MNKLFTWKYLGVGIVLISYIIPFFVIFFIGMIVLIFKNYNIFENKFIKFIFLPLNQIEEYLDSL